MRRRGAGMAVGLLIVIFLVCEGSAFAVGAISFKGVRAFQTGDGPQAVAGGDFNGDGKADLAVASGGFSDDISVLLGNGDGTFQAQKKYAVGTGLASLAIGDFNGDGKADLAVAGGAVMVLRGRGDGTFAAGARMYSTGCSSSLAAGDFNGDGKADLAAPDGVNKVSILINTTKPYPAAPASGETEGLE